MKLHTVLQTSIEFAYGQFMVFDMSASGDGVRWTEAHVNQGFARTASFVLCGTMVEYGNADLTVCVAPYLRDPRYQRVIVVPFESTSGHVQIDGPEHNDPDHVIQLPVGHYEMTIAQFVVTEDHEEISVFFQPRATPLTASRIILADTGLMPPKNLVEPDQ